MPSIMPAFAEFPAEAEIIGRLLAGYTNLEIGLMNCVQVVRLDFDTVLKAMFRARGETVRIDIADAFGRHYYDGLKLGTEFSMAISAVFEFGISTRIARGGTTIQANWLSPTSKISRRVMRS